MAGEDDRPGRFEQGQSVGRFLQRYCSVTPPTVAPGSRRASEQYDPQLADLVHDIAYAKRSRPEEVKALRKRIDQSFGGKGFLSDRTGRMQLQKALSDVLADEYMPASEREQMQRDLSRYALAGGSERAVFVSNMLAGCLVAPAVLLRNPVPKPGAAKAALRETPTDAALAAASRSRATGSAQAAYRTDGSGSWLVVRRGADPTTDAPATMPRAQPAKPSRTFSPPHERHNANSVRPKHQAKDTNSVVEPDVPIDQDVRAINEGSAERVAGKFVVHGRTYGEHERRLYPISGPGIHRLDRGAFKALGFYNKYGPGSETETMIARHQIHPQARDEAFRIYLKVRSPHTR